MPGQGGTEHGRVEVDDERRAIQVAVTHAVESGRAARDAQAVGEDVAVAGVDRTDLASGTGVDQRAPAVGVADEHQRVAARGYPAVADTGIGSELCTSGRIPLAQRAVRTGGEDGPSARRERRMPAPATMAAERDNRPTVGDVPHLDGLIAHEEQRSVRAQRPHVAHGRVACRLGA